jgi:hypothetical protein
MTEIAGSSPLPPTTPKKASPWIITIAVILILSCCCFGVIGLLFAFWNPLLQAMNLHALLPIQTILH